MKTPPTIEGRLHEPEVLFSTGSPQVPGAVGLVQATIRKNIG